METGLRLLLQHGYHDLSIQVLLAETDLPKGSFYHHFNGKADFVLQVVSAYMDQVHAALDHCLGDETRTPLDRIRRFFEQTAQAYREQGIMGCLLGGLGQELSGVDDTFRVTIESCLVAIASRMADCLELARRRGDLPADAVPSRLGTLLVDCWEGAALRSRLRHSSEPLDAMIDFYFAGAGARVKPAPGSPRRARAAHKTRRSSASLR